MFYKDSMNTKMFIEFVKPLIKDGDRRIFLILDNMQVHHGRVVKAWLKDNREKIELFSLPAYSPELNPDEYLNCDFKAGVHARSSARDTEGLKKKVRSHRKKLQKSAQRVKKYFKQPKISYAAESVSLAGELHGCSELEQCRSNCQMPKPSLVQRGSYSDFRNRLPVWDM